MARRFAPALSRGSFYTSRRSEAVSDIGICIPREQFKVLIAFRRSNVSWVLLPWTEVGSLNRILRGTSASAVAVYEPVIKKFVARCLLIRKFFRRRS